MNEPGHSGLSVARQFELLSVSRSGLYDQPAGGTAETLALMRLTGARFLDASWYGSCQTARHLWREGQVVGRKRVRRLMALIGLAPICQRLRTTVPNPAEPLGLRREHLVWPYLLCEAVDRLNQVRAMDITCIPMRRGFLYLVAVVEPRGSPGIG